MAPSIESLEAFFTKRADRRMLARLDLDAIPEHVAIIMDGNGRWAAKRGIPRSLGHKAGAQAVREAIATSLELGITYLTIFSFSSENWRRPADEIEGLMSLFVDVLTHECPKLLKHGVRVKVIGSEKGVPAKTMTAFRAVETETSECDNMTLLVALNYGGRMEIVNAVQRIVDEVAGGSLKPDSINEDLVSERMYTTGIPDPDLLIRTSGELRISNFLLWQIAYSEFWTTPVLWPDFRRSDLLKAIVDFQGRSRRFGASL